MECLKAGSGDLTLVFINGFRMPFSSWDKVYPVLSQHHSVFLYNRYGIGESTQAKTPQTADSVVTDLHNLLAWHQVQTPVVLVGHSLGGLFANLYARRYPEQVAAAVMIDASQPDEIIAQQAFEPPKLLNALNKTVRKVETWFDPFRYSEDDHIELSVEQIRQAGEFPDIPLTVISGTKKMPFVPQTAFDLHLSYQQALLKLSANSRQIMAVKSGHFPQLSEPDLVIEQILNTCQSVS
ncbi:alpha/beta hydrolase [Catenovulum sp. SM1970]|nr:alpha/beta hydrolase [Marinifaba aquimaris]